MVNQTKIGEVNFNVGDIVEVSYKVIESEKVSGVKKHEEKEEVRERFQPFEGVVLAINHNQSFVVRKLAVGDIGIERVFPLNSPWVGKIKVKKKGTARKAKLYNLRQLKSKF